MHACTCAPYKTTTPSFEFTTYSSLSFEFTPSSHARFASFFFSTLFCHVFPIFFATSEKKKFFSPLFFPPPTPSIMFYLPECQFYICSDFLALQIQQLQLPIFEFPQSNYFPAILPTQSTISVQPQIFNLQQLSLPHAIQPANKRSCNDFNNCHWSLIFQSPSTAAQQLPQFLLPRFRQLPLTIDFSASIHKSFPTSCSSCKFTIIDV